MLQLCADPQINPTGVRVEERDFLVHNVRRSALAPGQHSSMGLHPDPNCAQVDIEWGRKTTRKDSWDKEWETYDPIANVGFYNPKESVPRVNSLSKDNLPSGEGRRCSNRTIYLYMRPDRKSLTEARSPAHLARASPERVISSRAHRVCAGARRASGGALGGLRPIQSGVEARRRRRHRQLWATHACEWCRPLDTRLGR